MNNLTYLDLLIFLKNMSPEDLQTHVTVYTPNEEYIPIESIEIAQDDGVIDPGGYVLSCAGVR